MLMYDSLNLTISGVHQSLLCSWGHRSEKVKLRGLDCVAYKMCLTKRQNYYPQRVCSY